MRAMGVRAKGQLDNAGDLRHHFRADCSRELLVKRPQRQSIGVTGGIENGVVGEVGGAGLERRKRSQYGGLILGDDALGTHQAAERGCDRGTIEGVRNPKYLRGFDDHYRRKPHSTCGNGPVDRVAPPGGTVPRHHERAGERRRWYQAPLRPVAPFAMAISMSAKVTAPTPAGGTSLAARNSSAVGLRSRDTSASPSASSTMTLTTTAGSSNLGAQ